MSPRSLVIISVARENVLQMTLPQDDNVIQTFPTYRTNYPFGIRILPGRSVRGKNLCNPECYGLTAKRLSVDGVCDELLSTKINSHY